MTFAALAAANAAAAAAVETQQIVVAQCASAGGCLATKREPWRHFWRQGESPLVSSLKAIEVLWNHLAPWLPLVLCIYFVALGPPSLSSYGGRDGGGGALLGLGTSWLVTWMMRPLAGAVHCVGGEGWSQTVLVAAVLSLWYLGLPPGPAESDWSLPALPAPAAAGTPPPRGLPGSPSAVALLDISAQEAGRRAVVGLIVLDDLLRVILRFVAGSPLEVWPFAVCNRYHYSLWMTGCSNWWEDSYLSASWMTLPPNTGRLGNRGSSSIACVLSKAVLVASVAAEAFGSVVVFPPECTLSCWVAAPLVTSTLLVATRGPSRLDTLLLAVMELVRLASKCGVYFQAVWLLAAYLLPTQDTALRAHGSGWGCYRQAALGVLEVLALSGLYVALASRVSMVLAWRRTAEPLYAVPIEMRDSSPLAGRPLYCGSLGQGVEGTYAPTRMCDWDDASDGSGLLSLPWRERFRLRARAEALTAREARLLSFLDALAVRIREAESCGEDENSGIAAAIRPACRPRQRRRAILACGAALVSLLGAGVAWRFHLSLCPHSVGLIEAAFWLVLFARAAHYYLRAALPRLLAAWEAYRPPRRRNVGDPELAALRQQAHAHHQCLAETQRQLCHLEARLESLGVRARRLDHGETDRGCKRLCGWDFQPLVLGCWLCSVGLVCFRSRLLQQVVAMGVQGPRDMHLRV
eukprot:TRINITY_DN22937_c0_g1_i1.p1 TRINITY_DN22937_c0_g1~~TRINITY_DN22937_c0_g1_i1.p1  ORF type:complete len:692 (+),score=99.21 TRINITY_DN22937_c0_g1_i1:147-2222(+)